MTEVLKGKTIEEARRLFQQFHAKVTGGAPEDLPEALQDDSERLEPLTGVRAYPVRVKCATLPWHAFEAALKSGIAGDTVKTE
jgi:nitrogen fixation protein NifU and related proteins